MKKILKNISTKDKIIVALTAVAVLVLMVLLYLARRNDQMTSEVLVESTKEDVQDFSMEDTAQEEGVVQSGLLITEINADKWVELYNNSNADYDISGFTVNIAGEKVLEFEQNTKVTKDSFFVFDVSTNPGSKNTNLLSIKDRNGNDVISIIVPTLSQGQSYGRRTKDSNDMGYVTPSKGTDNENPEDYQMVSYGGIEVSAPSGFYNTAFNVTLKAEEGKTIYYTLDGTEPTSESTKYETPITISNMSGSNFVYAALAFEYEQGADYYPGSIDKGVVLRAISVDSSGKLTGETMQTYYVGLLRKTDYQKLPVVSVTAESEDLFGYFNGIYIGGRIQEDGIAQGKLGEGNYRQGWSVPAKIEFFESGKGKSYEASGQMTISGGDGRALRQKGFTINVGSGNSADYAGSSIMDSINSKNEIILDAHDSDSDLKIRDLLINSLIDESEVANMEDHHCIVFINGEYWGIYTLSDSLDQKYLEREYGITATADIYNANDYSEPYEEFYNYVVQNDMSIAENYANLKNRMDIDSYLQYICTNIYTGNYESNSKYCFAWKTTQAGSGKYGDGKWRWGLRSMDLTMGISKETSSTIDTFLFPAIANDPFFNSLLMNKEFCDSLVKTMDEVGNGYFSTEKWTQALSAYTALLKRPDIASRTRFYGGYNDSSFLNGVAVIEKYLTRRYEYVSVYVKEVAQKGGDMNVIQAERDRINSGEAVTMQQ